MSSSLPTRPGPGTARTDLALAAGLAVLAIGFSAVFSHGAPCGLWVNRIFDTPAWGEADPGAWYLFAAHQQARQAQGTAPPTPIYHGHPGTPLLLLLRGVQQAFVAVAAPDAAVGDAARDRFLAQRLSDLFWWSKLAVTLLHLVSFLALFLMARALLEERRAALLSVLAYASAFPVLYYLSRISPEPIAVACLAGALPAFWRYEALAVAGRTARALACLVAAGALAATAVVAKLQLAAALPPLLLAMAATDFPRRLAGPALRWRIRLAASLTLAAATAAALGLYGRWIDWRPFLAYWSGLPAVRAGLSADAFAAADLDLSPGLSAADLLPTAEAVHAGLAVAGLTWLLRRCPERRPRALAVCALGAFSLLLLGYRVALAGSFLPFHYAFPALALAAPFAGLALARLERRLLGTPGPVGAALFALGAVLAVHGLAIVAVVDARRHDVRVFEPNRAAWERIARLDPAGAGAPLLVEDATHPQRPIPTPALRARLARLHGWPAAGLLGVGGPTPALATAFESLFATLPVGGIAPELTRVPAPLLRANLVPVDGELELRAQRGAAQGAGSEPSGPR